MFTAAMQVSVLLLLWGMRKLYHLFQRMKREDITEKVFGMVRQAHSRTQRL